ncbi:MAG: phenylalanine--tRNA ligase subunit beta, partial [Candidatus Babeliales bacterium]
MKLSLSWIFDYIDGDWKNIDVAQLVHTFNTTTAEIEHAYPLALNLDQLSLVHVSSAGNEQVVAESQEWGTTYTLPARADAKEGSYYFVHKKEGMVVWARLADFGGQKEGLMPVVSCADDCKAGSWKKEIASQDYILDIDNKSITNRPDLWSHRGFAREIAAILDLPFKDFGPFLADKPVVDYSVKAPGTKLHPFTVIVEDQQACPRFAGIYISDIGNRPSLIAIAARLARVDSKPIDMLVDLTNYVMLDMSQPMHAFDAEKLSAPTIIPRFAKNGEKLTLLDGQIITLTAQDFMITDGAQSIALAGVMGGKSTGVSLVTTKIFLEAASFNPNMIRLSALRHKVRTDASARFEKSLDPNQNLLAIKRFLKLLDENNISYTAAPEIISLGQYAHDSTIEIVHSYIEKRLGVAIASEFIIATLEKIGFSVASYPQDNDLLYIITVPSFRGTKDVVQKEDILEEVVRFFGFENIPYQLPEKKMEIADSASVYRLRDIKNYMAYTIAMHEIASYGFFDESYLNELGYKPVDMVTLKNPVSQNWQHLVTTLIPHMLQAVQENSANNDHLRFFEWARIWHAQNNEVIEKRFLVSIAYDASATMSFYEAKAWYEGLFHMLDLCVTWQKASACDVWYDSTQTAYIMHNGTRIGVLGRLSQQYLQKISDKGAAFIAELDGDFLLAYKAAHRPFKPLAKFPHISLDVSALVPLSVSVSDLTMAIEKSDPTIVSVGLVDVFEKPEW